MRSMERRVEKLENILGVRREIQNAIICFYSGDSRGLPKDITKWITYQEQLTAEPTGSIRLIIMEPDKEQEARARVIKGNEK